MLPPIRPRPYRRDHRASMRRVKRVLVPLKIVRKNRVLRRSPARNRLQAMCRATLPETRRAARMLIQYFRS